MSSVRKRLSSSRVEHQIHEILSHPSFKMHTNESLLSCCTLLLLLQENEETDANHPTVLDIVYQHRCILEFAFRLIIFKFQTEPRLARLGVRIFIKCLECKGENKIISLTQNIDWDILTNTLVQHCCDYGDKISSENSKLGLFTVEFIHLMVLVMQKIPSTIIKSEIFLGLLPSIINACLDCRKLKLEIDDKLILKTDERDIVDFILDRTVEEGIILNWTLSLTHASAEFLTLCLQPYMNSSNSFHLNDSTISDERVSKCSVHSILNHTVLMSVMNLLFLELEYHDERIWASKKEALFMLHHGCISMLMIIIVQDCDDVLQNVKTSEMIQKLLFSGFASHGDIILKSNDTGIIRSMTLSIISTLLDKKGHTWLCIPKDSETSSDDHVLGNLAPFCSTARLVAGELRIVLGLMLDNLFDSKKSDKDEQLSDDDGTVERKNHFGNDAIRRGIDCLQILLYILNVLVEVAKDDDDESFNREHLKKNCSPMTADAILHFRHTLEDAFNSCVQYLSEELIPYDISPEQKSLYHICCRFIGGFLTEVNIFDYFQYSDDDLNVSVDHISVYRHKESQKHSDDQQNTVVTALYTTDILRAIKNGFSMFLKIHGDTDEMNFYNIELYTLIPCIVSLLVCCEEYAHVQTVVKFLLNDAVISDTLVELLKRVNLRISTYGVKSLDDETINCSSWCCILIKSILDFDALNKPKTYPSCLTKTSRQNATRQIYGISRHIALVARDSNDPHDKERVIPLFVNVVECWTQLDDNWNLRLTSKALHIRDDEIIMMMNYYEWLETNGYFINLR